MSKKQDAIDYTAFVIDSMIQMDLEESLANIETDIRDLYNEMPDSDTHRIGVIRDMDKRLFRMVKLAVNLNSQYHALVRDVAKFEEKY